MDFTTFKPIAALAPLQETRYSGAVLPEAVLLDLDGTLVDSESFHTEAIARYMASRGVVLDARERSFVIGHAWQEIHAELQVHTRLGDDLPALQAGAHSAKTGMVAEGLQMRVLDGARELVVTLEALGIRRALVSGSSRREIAEALELLEFSATLEFYMGAEDYARGKPAPDGYLDAAGRMGIDPARCLVFEDSHAGVTSAVNAGMRVIATAAVNAPEGSLGYQDQRAAHHVVAQLSQVDEALMRAVMR